MHTTIIIRAEPSDSTCTAIERAEALGAEADQLREEAAQIERQMRLLVRRAFVKTGAAT
jgi:hypothetical protein